MQTICDNCKNPVKKVGRLSRVQWKGLTQRLCKVCKKRIKMAYH